LFSHDFTFVTETLAMRSPAKSKEHLLPGEDAADRIVHELAGNEPAARLLGSTGGSQPAIVDLRQLSCVLAHELRQPLFTISMANENMRLMLECAERDEEGMRQAVLRIAEQVERAQAIIEQTLSSTKAQHPPRDSADIVDVARRSADLIADLPQADDVEFLWQLPEERMLVGVSRVELEQLFVNLLRNAVESIADRRRSGWHGSGRVIITVQAIGGEVRCVLLDNGAGVLPSTLKAVFDPFFTTKGSGGAGLGLHICRQIVSDAGGTIQLRPGRMEGAQVELRLSRVAYGTA
jgi:two-component system C4-dicarboxylate transport sensor histidine kinase DctB/two-component system sensor histidine kinase TtrS